MRWLSARLFDPSSQWIALCVGFGILAFAVLVLMVSRWGQVRPLHKCAVLSVFAHLLLVGVAYMIQLYESPPPGLTTSTVRVSLEPDHDPAIEPPLRRPWEASPLEMELPPDRVVLERDDRAERDPTTKRSWTADVPIGSLPQLPAPVTGRAEPADMGPTIQHRSTRPEVPGRDRAAPPSPITAELASVRPTQSDTTAQLAGHRPSPTSRDRDEESIIGSASAPTSTDRDVATSAPVRRPDGEAMPDVYQARFDGNRMERVLQLGGSRSTEAAVEFALQYLARTQSRDGRWDASTLEAGRETFRGGHDREEAGQEADSGITALALLAFMGAGNTHVAGTYQPVIQHGLEFLLSQQDANGSLAGSAGSFAAMYCHAMSTLAVAEALALTGDSRLDKCLRRAVGYTLDAQHPESGGWRYRPWRYDPTDLGDMSLFGWHIMGLRSAERAGVSIPPATWTRASHFLQSCSHGEYDGLASYQPTRGPSLAMTGEALFVRYLMRRHHRLQIEEGARYLLDHRPGAGNVDYYAWYYGTLALFSFRDRAWEGWNRAMTRQLLPSQVASGPLKGSWAPDTTWGSYGGRVYSTSLAALCLEVYYRYSPMVQQ